MLIWRGVLFGISRDMWSSVSRSACTIIQVFVGTCHDVLWQGMWKRGQKQEGMCGEGHGALRTVETRKGRST